MRDIGFGGHGSGGGFEFSGQCHGCKRVEKHSVIKAAWLEPYFVKQPDDEYLQTQLCPKCARWHLRYWIKTVFKLRIGRLSDFLVSGYSHCGRCKTNWHYCEGHATRYYQGGGCFPLCEKCWAELTPETRLPFYREMFERWEGVEAGVWPAIERAVRNGL